MLGYEKLYTSVAEKSGRRGMFSKIVPQSTLHHTSHYPSSFHFLPSFLDTERNKYYLHDRAHRWTDRNDNSRCIATAIVTLLRYNYVRWYVPTMLLSCGRLSLWLQKTHWRRSIFALCNYKQKKRSISRLYKNTYNWDNYTIND